MRSTVKFNFKTPTLKLFIALIAVLLFSGGGAVWAIARGYISDDTELQTGMVAALSVDSVTASKVERASQDNTQRVVGVVTTVEKSLVTVASGSAKVLVESEGEVEAYVSDINGEPKQGDLLVISPFKGVLMKSESQASTVLGIAAGNFEAGTKQTYTLENSSETTEVAKIRVNLNRQGSTNINITPDSTLSRLGQAVVGKKVGEIRVLIALFIFLTVLIAEGGILYGAISSAIAALGRNPLARKIIRAELFRVIIIAIFVLLVGVGAIYAILWI